MTLMEAVLRRRTHAELAQLFTARHEFAVKLKFSAGSTGNRGFVPGGLIVYRMDGALVMASLIRNVTDDFGAEVDDLFGCWMRPGQNPRDWTWLSAAQKPAPLENVYGQGALTAYYYVPNVVEQILLKSRFV